MHFIACHAIANGGLQVITINVIMFINNVMMVLSKYFNAYKSFIMLKENSV